MKNKNLQHCSNISTVLHSGSWDESGQASRTKAHWIALSQNVYKPALAKHVPVNMALTLYEPAELKVNLKLEGFRKWGRKKNLNCSLPLKDSPASTFVDFQQNVQQNKIIKLKRKQREARDGATSAKPADEWTENTVTTIVGEV